MGNRLETAAALLAVGAASSETGKFADAVAAYEKAVELDSHHPDVHVNLGALLEVLGQTIRGRETL